MSFTTHTAWLAGPALTQWRSANPGPSAQFHEVHIGELVEVERRTSVSLSLAAMRTVATPVAAPVPLGQFALFGSGGSYDRCATLNAALAPFGLRIFIEASEGFTWDLFRCEADGSYSPVLQAPSSPRSGPVRFDDTVTFADVVAWCVEAV